MPLPKANGVSTSSGNFNNNFPSSHLENDYDYDLHRFRPSQLVAARYYIKYFIWKRKIQFNPRNSKRKKKKNEKVDTLNRCLRDSWKQNANKKGTIISHEIPICWSRSISFEHVQLSGVINHLVVYIFPFFSFKRSAIHFERDSKHMDRELAGLSPPIYPPYKSDTSRPFIPKTVLYDRLVYIQTFF